MPYENIKNFNSFKGKLWNMSINDFTVLENKLIDQRSEIDDKLTLINEIIRIKENDRHNPKIY